MKVIGLTGGIGSGKSRILEILNQEYGALVIQADLVAKKLMEPGQASYDKVLELLGTGILASDGTIDRTRMADRIFKDPRLLEAVNCMTHPLVWKEIQNEIEQSDSKLIIVEAALMGKEQGDNYDEVWYVYTSEENRLNRLGKNRGYSRDKSISIMKTQPTEETFRALSNYVIDNNGTIEETRKQIADILGGTGQER